jgi:hypothetical protein
MHRVSAQIYRMSIESRVSAAAARVSGPDRAKGTSVMKHLALILGVAIAVTIGALAVVAGEADDSPGLQGARCPGRRRRAGVGIRRLRRNKQRS